MKSCRPRISVITPSFNQAAFLERTLDSVRSQSFADFEHIVVDGGSTDGSRAILERRAQEFSWWCAESDEGQADAINKGLRRARGEILAWLNSDDLYCPGALAAVDAFFRQHPECDVVMGDLEIIDSDDQLLDVKKAIPVSLRWNLYSGCAIPQPATFFTRRAYEIAGELDVSLRYQMDYEFFLRMQARGVRFGVMRRPLARFRLHRESKTVSDYDRKFWRDFSRIQDRHGRRFPAGRLGELIRKAMKWETRMEMYLLRAFTRGAVQPFRYARIRRRGGTTG